MASPPYSVLLTNNTSYTFTTIIKPAFLLPAAFTGYSSTLGPSASWSTSASSYSNLITFKVSGAHAGQIELWVRAINDGSSWHAVGYWVTDQDTLVYNPPTDIHIVSGTTGSGIHTVTIESGPPSKMRRGAAPGMPVAKRFAA
ncbi:hypothetical protein DRE_03854 [Drechslerella stenobrocha 248]|uniref:Uncharacterized protein n=1 Tax=Drechslerella stenobrocha 248 TaxID=1043628 RepID=W7I377_9PEZI|nr:hypothetical protein DRE_03854 [Drechslerella stenobrocha 248]